MTMNVLETLGSWMAELIGDVNMRACKMSQIMAQCEPGSILVTLSMTVMLSIC
jgi:hypothetical protein